MTEVSIELLRPLMGQWRVFAMKEFISISAKTFVTKMRELTNDYEICGDFPSCSILKASRRMKLLWQESTENECTGAVSKSERQWVGRKALFRFGNNAETSLIQREQDRWRRAGRTHTTALLDHSHYFTTACTTGVQDIIKAHPTQRFDWCIGASVHALIGTACKAICGLIG